MTDEQFAAAYFEYVVIDDIGDHVTSEWSRWVFSTPEQALASAASWDERAPDSAPHSVVRRAISKWEWFAAPTRRTHRQAP